MGPVEGVRLVRSYLADVDLAAGIGVIAGASATSVKLPTAPNQQAEGITLQPTPAGQMVPVLEFGEVKAVADAAIARGQLVMINATTGKLAPIGAVAGTNYFVVGLALEAAAAQDNDFVLFVNMSRAQG